MTGPDTPSRVNAQAGTLAVPRLVPTARVVGLAAVTSSGVVAQAGHCLLLVSSRKVFASLSTGTFMVEPSGQVTTPAGAPDGAGPVKTRSPLMKSSLSWTDGKPPLGPEDSSSSGAGTTKPVRQAFASGERAQATASCRASASKAPTLPAPGGGLAVDIAVGADTGAPTPPTDVAADSAADEPTAPAAHPATAAAARQAASRGSDRRSTRTMSASRKASQLLLWTRPGPHRFPPVIAPQPVGVSAVQSLWALVATRVIRGVGDSEGYLVGDPDVVARACATASTP